MSKESYLESLPTPIPRFIQQLPVQNGYPVPWFVAKVGNAYDFRCIDARKFKPAIKQKLCWICGNPLSDRLSFGQPAKQITFAIGPMCAINRIISEPPAHYECAVWSAKACPFLAQHQQHRRETDLPQGITEPGGIGIKRQPGVTLIWTCQQYRIVKTPNGLLFEIGDPIAVLWLRKGRPATREECVESIESGYPILLEMAGKQGPLAVEELKRQRQRAEALLPSPHQSHTHEDYQHGPAH